MASWARRQALRVFWPVLSFVLDLNSLSTKEMKKPTGLHTFAAPSGPRAAPGRRARPNVVQMQGARVRARLGHRLHQGQP
jgi:hypothetical protein